MRNPIAEPTTEIICRTLGDNILHRNTSVADFINLINNLEGHHSIVLDGEWGSGKTYFIKQIELILNSLNNDILKDDPCFAPTKLAIGKDIDLAKLSLENKIIPIYYNSWLYDNHPEPAVSILYAICKAEALTKKIGIDRSASDIVTSIIDILNFWTNGSVKDLKDSIKGNNIFENIQSLENINEKFGELVNKILERENDKILIIIDELDRCKPTYALEILERMKHFFTNDNIIFLYAANKSQLAHTICHEYGVSFDSHNYFNRFFDINISLSLYETNKMDFLYSIGFENTSYFIDIITNRVINYFDFSLRELSSFIQTINKIKKNPICKQSNWLPLFIPYLLALRISKCDLAHKFEKGAGEEEFLLFIFSSEDLVDILRRNISHNHEEGDAFIKDYMKRLYWTIFNESYVHENRENAIDVRFENINKKTILSLFIQ